MVGSNAHVFWGADCLALSWLVSFWLVLSCPVQRRSVGVSACAALLGLCYCGWPCSGDHLLSWSGTVRASSRREAATFAPLFEHDSLPEWSKGVDSSSTSASCVGSNPTAVRLLALALSPSRPLRGLSRRRRCQRRCELGAPSL